jgi:uncharacterized NAD(P)/FAD-binding protein YdhS
MSHSKEIVIVGDGFAAAVLAIHLLHKGVDGAFITIIGPRVPGQGNAYSCESPFYRLNVREDLPIIFSEDPLHFAKWAEQHLNDPLAKTEAGFFYQRRDFGRYVAELLSHQIGAKAIDHVAAKVEHLRRQGQHWELSLSNQRSLTAQYVILATGNPPPRWPCPVVAESDSASAWLASHAIENPWTGDHLSEIKPDEAIALLGGGLTALDAISALVGQGHRGMIQVISPRAVFPPSQAHWQRCHQVQWPNHLTPARLLRFMREYLPSSPSNETQWQNAWEELRPKLSEIWQQFSTHQRRILLKRVGWLWSLYRFRASPQTITAYEQLKRNQQIEFALGRAQKIICTSSKIKVLLGDGNTVSADRVINCTGVGKDALLLDLIANRTATSDALGQSIAVDQQFRVLDSNIQAQANLWMIGPETMASLGDVVAASAIAKQAEQLADQITDHIVQLKR